MVKDKQNNAEKIVRPIGSDFIERFWEKSWTYIKTVVDVVREPVLILDKDFRVMAANDPFYRTFQVKEEETKGKIVYELGNGQWNIPALQKLLEDILPKQTFFKGFEVIHEFPIVGRKVMILNARQIHVREEIAYQPIILLAMEDITDMMDVAEMLSRHTIQFESEMVERTGKLDIHIKELEKEIDELKSSK